MSIDNSTADRTHQVPTTVTDWFESIHPDTTPLVRYGFPREGGGQKQEMQLRSLNESIPDNAITASAIYFVTDSQLERLDRFADNPFAIKGNANIVKEVQTECEDDNRVLYPIYVESDARENGVSFTAMIDWIWEFIEGELSVSPAECTFWYSGSRSIHAHLPKFFSQSQLTKIRNKANQYCTEADAELDSAIYKSKQQFRLPGVAHRKSEGALQKVEIEPSWQNDQIIRKSSANHSKPESYLDMLEKTFTPQLEGSSFALTLDEIKEHEIETPLIEQVNEYPESPADVPEWSMYNTDQFSPYALAAGNNRSVAALRVKGGAFSRAKKRNGATMVPAKIYGAIGCDGTYTKFDRHAPLQLSESDYQKWNANPGDDIVIIGGQSRNSRILEVSPAEASYVGAVLSEEGDNRQEALSYLADKGYDVGASGSQSSNPLRDRVTSGKPVKIWPARENPRTRPEELQRKAEQEGIDTLTHDDRILVAFRHLRQGWEPTWEWFEEQYGDDFDPKYTWKLLKSIVEGGYDEYDEVTVPDSPS